MMVPSVLLQSEGTTAFLQEHTSVILETHSVPRSLLLISRILLLRTTSSPGLLRRPSTCRASSLATYSQHAFLSIWSRQCQPVVLVIASLDMVSPCTSHYALIHAAMCSRLACPSAQYPWMKLRWTWKWTAPHRLSVTPRMIPFWRLLPIVCPRTVRI